MASSYVKSHLDNNLMENYGIRQSNVDRFYNETCNLYHELCTLIDFAPLQRKTDKILSSLVIMTRENIEFNNDHNRYGL
jgi:hypothetical protein